MARKQKTITTISLNGEDIGKLANFVDIITNATSLNDSEVIAQIESRDYKIIFAIIKDRICNYHYEITKGLGAGDVHKVDGTFIVKEDMLTSFSLMNAHMAVVDDVFKHAGIEIEDINTMHGDEHATIFSTTAFACKGGDGDESVTLSGSKYVSSGGRIELKTPKIALDDFSSYKHFKSMRSSLNKLKLEVILYKEGKYEMPEKDEEDENPKQLQFTTASNDIEKENDEFENGRM